MTQVDIEVAKGEFGPVLDRVMHGEPVTIVEGGRPVARVLPVVTQGSEQQTPEQEQRRKEAIENIDRLRASLEPGGYSWEEMKKLRDFGRPGCE